MGSPSVFPETRMLPPRTPVEQGGPEMDEFGRISLSPGQTKLSDAQKRQLYHDGFLIIKGALSKEMTGAAKAAIKQTAALAKRGEQPAVPLGANEAMTGLVNGSVLTPLLTEAMGTFTPPHFAQVGILPIQRDGAGEFGNTGYRRCEMPYYASETHIDGSITIGVPQEKWEGTEEERYWRHIHSGPKGSVPVADVIGHNSGVLFTDPEQTLGLGSFSAFIICCLNNQLSEYSEVCACWPALLLVHQFFCYQRDHPDNKEGRMAIEGPAYPRLDYHAPNGCGLVYLPDMVRNAFVDENSEATPDGRLWPRPMQLLMDEGDACFTVFHIPHSGTRNQNGTESRKNIIFRIRADSHQPCGVHALSGVNDHPDRGQAGEWLEYPEGVDPYARSKHLLCHPWEVWDGMQDVIREEQAKGFFGRELGPDGPLFATDATHPLAPKSLAEGARL